MPVAQNSSEQSTAADEDVRGVDVSCVSWVAERAIGDVHLAVLGGDTSVALVSQGAYRHYIDLYKLMKIYADVC